MQPAERRPSMESNEAQYLFTESELNALIADERAAEREACAQVCEEHGKVWAERMLLGFQATLDDVAKAIRARGQK